MRWKEISLAVVAAAGVISANMNLLHFSNEVNDVITLVCLILLAVNHSIISPKNNG